MSQRIALLQWQLFLLRGRMRSLSAAEPPWRRAHAEPLRETREAHRSLHSRESPATFTPPSRESPATFIQDACKMRPRCAQDARAASKMRKRCAQYARDASSRVSTTPRHTTQPQTATRYCSDPARNAATASQTPRKLPLLKSTLQHTLEITEMRTQTLRSQGNATFKFPPKGVFPPHDA